MLPAPAHLSRLHLASCALAAIVCSLVFFSNVRSPSESCRSPSQCRFSAAQSNNSHHFVDALALHSFRTDQVRFLANKTILFLGDSVMRETIYQLCYTIDGTASLLQPEGSQPNFAEEWKTNLHLCKHNQLQLQFISAFLYGVSDPADPEAQAAVNNEWPKPPWGFEDRLVAIKGYLKEYKVDVILANSGAWDFKYLFRKELYLDLQHGGKAEYPGLFPDSTIRQYSTRLKLYFDSIKQTFPQIPIVFFGMQPFVSNDEVAKMNWSGGLLAWNSVALAKCPPLFSPKRVAQLTAAYAKVAQEERIPIIDTTRIAHQIGSDAFFKPGDTVHPSQQGSMLIIDQFLDLVYNSRWL